MLGLGGAGGGNSKALFNHFWKAPPRMVRGVALARAPRAPGAATAPPAQLSGETLRLKDAAAAGAAVPLRNEAPRTPSMVARWLLGDTDEDDESEEEGEGEGEVEEEEEEGGEEVHAKETAPSSAAAAAAGAAFFVRMQKDDLAGQLQQRSGGGLGGGGADGAAGGGASVSSSGSESDSSGADASADEESVKLALGFEPFMDSADLVAGDAADTSHIAGLDEMAREVELASRYEKFLEFKKNYAAHEDLRREKAKKAMAKAKRKKKMKKMMKKKH